MGTAGSRRNSLGRTWVQMAQLEEPFLVLEAVDNLGLRQAWIGQVKKE